MAKTEELQKLWRRYQNDHGHVPAGTRPVVEWAVKEGLMELPKVDPYDVASHQMAKALRDETDIDAQGHTYRVNHAVKISSHGVQTSIWGILGHAPVEHIDKSHGQRREMVISDLVSLHHDIEARNSKYPDSEPKQLETDFTEDVKERLVAEQLRFFPARAGR
ncbi:MAG: hypothetical protein M0Z61_01285 [Nitrospiraceae bacterium]|nr:hypothetical protein [Nitrospiraceae bacterium]